MKVEKLYRLEYKGDDDIYSDFYSSEEEAIFAVSSFKNDILEYYVDEDGLEVGSEIILHEINIKEVEDIYFYADTTILSTWEVDLLETEDARMDNVITSDDHICNWEDSKRMKEVVQYPILAMEREDHIVIRIPDFNGMTQANELHEVVPMAKDYIELMILDNMVDGEKIPKPTDIWKIREGYSDYAKGVVKVDLHKLRKLAERERENKNENTKRN